MKGIKCESCGKQIAKASIKVGVVEIKCGKCGTVNQIKGEEKPYGERLVYNQK